jgi:hypothetical protein
VDCVLVNALSLALEHVPGGGMAFLGCNAQQSTLTVSKSGNEFTGKSFAEVFDTDGNVSFQSR